MTIELAEWIVAAVEIYLGVGALFALAFVVAGVARIDPGAKGMTLAARVLIFPGAAVLWPVMLCKWLTRAGPPES